MFCLFKGIVSRTKALSTLLALPTSVSLWFAQDNRCESFNAGYASYATTSSIRSQNEEERGSLVSITATIQNRTQASKPTIRDARMPVNPNTKTRTGLQRAPRERRATAQERRSSIDSSLKNIDPWLQKTVPPKNQKRLPEGSLHQLAEGEGFEPSLPRLEAKRFSRPPHSAALPPFQVPLFATKCVAEFVKRKRSRERFW